MKNKTSKKINVLIYGAGEAGRQLGVSLEKNNDFKVVGFLDDNKKLKNKTLLGRTINYTNDLKKIAFNLDIGQVFIAMPSISRRKRNQIVKKLSKLKIIVKTLPSISEIIDGRVTVSDIKDINIDDLLNRQQVKPDIKLLKKNINKKIVLVTGAGGSIGSELCRQIIKLKPLKLLLLELNEFALYNIREELIKNYKSQNIVSLLGDSQDQAKLQIIFETFKVSTVYHTAAYKHVPLVEENICAGVKNNVFSTFIKASLY